MRSRVIITEPAQNDLEELRNYIITQFQNYISADRIYFALKKAILGLDIQPFHIKYFGKYYCIKVESYYIFYEIRGERVFIVRILHRLRNIKNILK